MLLSSHQFLVGVAFQPRKKVALKSRSINRGWKAAPTDLTPFLKLMTLRGTLKLIFFFLCLRVLVAELLKSTLNRRIS